MTTTIGISAERTVVRGVLLANTPGKPSEVLRAVHQRGDDGASIVDTLDALARTAPAIADVAVAYHTTEDRQRIVSELAGGPWRTSSLVSTRSALFALIADLPELGAFGTVLMLHLADHTATAVVVGPDRRQILASDGWTTGFAEDVAVEGPAVDSDAMTETIGRVRSMLASIPAHADAVALSGSSAVDPEIANALRYELTARVILLPDPADATARGAALIAADQARKQAVPPARAARGRGAVVLTAAAVAAVLGVSGFVVSQAMDESAPTMNARSLDTTSSTPPSTAAPTTTEPQVSPTASPPPPAAQPPAPAPVTTPIPDNRIWADTPRPAPPVAAPAPTTTLPRDPAPAPEENPAPETTAPAAPPTPTRVGAPNPQGLFPGESPPPAAGSDPAAEQAWWVNHWNLKRQWMNGG
ncbi:hypothetical protein [Nocardia alba]|uniref:Uncharacterized protein n=1 Tax=Nocardia alba TaxID=225051 RepID=A0A4R1G3X3_9NOCA|nr:hypothetical protein [Nocardia alba]TCJ99958.1 hypothetical protein DFR71_0944 [Nocardia alba]